MSKETVLAQLRAAAWALVSIVGYREAMGILHSIAKEIENTLWEGPGNR